MWSRLSQEGTDNSVLSPKIIAATSTSILMTFFPINLDGKNFAIKILILKFNNILAIGYIPAAASSRLTLVCTKDTRATRNLT